MHPTSKALVLMEKKKFEIKEYPILDPAEAGALIKVELAGICGTDVHVYNGQVPGKEPYPVILGHEIVGKIEKLGECLTTDSQGLPIKEGDRVFVAPAIACGKCYKCLVSEAPTRCQFKKAYGFVKNPDQEPHLTGGFSSYLQMSYTGSLFLKTDVSPSSAVVLEPFTIALHALEKASIQIGDVVIVQGSGAIGLLTVLGAKLTGASKIISIGAPQGRLDLAKELGADVTINIEKYGPDERITIAKEHTPNGFGADVVLECAGSPKAVREGLDMLGEGGTFVEVGNFTDNGEVEINPFKHLIGKNNTVYGVWGAYPKHFIKGLRWIEKIPNVFSDLVTHIVPLERVGEIIDSLANNYHYQGKDIIKAAVRPDSQE